jgi:type II secretory pathway component GspD/PulD (secretin)
MFSYLENFAPGRPSNNRDRAFSAVINLLVQRGKARVIARPHLAAVSGRKARIEISEDRYIIVQTPAQGAAVNTTQPVQSGVILDITPQVTRDDRVRMALAVEQSSFIDLTPANVTTAVDKNKAETTMEVASGQAILIGGLTQHLRSFVTAGIPWLRHIPLLNLVFARFQSDSRRQEVLVFITPHIWRPGLDSPIPQPKAFSPQEPRDDFSPLERFNR